MISRRDGTSDIHGLASTKRIAQPLRGSECLEGDDGSRVGNSGNRLNLFGDEVADIRRRLDIEFRQEIKVPRC